MYTPNWQNTKENNQTALHVAAKNVDYFKISILIEYGFTTDGVYNLGGSMPNSGLMANSLTEDVNKAIEVSVDSAFTTDCFTSVDIYLTYQLIKIA